MTFDEAIEKIESITDELNIRQEIINDVVSVVEGLRKEYAPTILLTQNEYKELKAGHTLEEKIARISRLAHNSSDDSADGYVNDDMIMRSYLFPETIKVVGE